MCSSRKYLYSPTEGVGISWGVEDSVKPKKFQEMYEALLEFPEGWGVLEIKPSVGEVWIFSEITSFKNSKQSLETKPPQFYKVSLLNWSLQ